MITTAAAIVAKHSEFSRFILLTVGSRQTGIWQELRLMCLPPLKRIACKTQLRFDQILESSLLFCTKKMMDNGNPAAAAAQLSNMQQHAAWKGPNKNTFFFNSRWTLAWMEKGRWPISYSSALIRITPDTGNAIKLPVPLVGYQMCISTAKRIGQYSAPVALQRVKTVRRGAGAGEGRSISSR